MHIVESPKAKEQLDEACLRFINAQAAWDDLTWAILQDGTVGVPVTEDGSIRLVRDEGISAIDRPTIEIVYSAEHRSVEIIAVRFMRATIPRSGRA